MKRENSIPIPISRTALGFIRAPSQELFRKHDGLAISKLQRGIQLLTDEPTQTHCVYLAMKLRRTCRWQSVLGHIV